jgi:hypothetical protein
MSTKLALHRIYLMCMAMGERPPESNKSTETINVRVFLVLYMIINYPGVVFEQGTEFDDRLIRSSNEVSNLFHILVAHVAETGHMVTDKPAVKEAAHAFPRTVCFSLLNGCASH